MKAVLIGRGTWGKILAPYIEEQFDLISIMGKNYTVPHDAEAVFIATPIETHYDIVKDCLLQGKHVFCEKPLTTSHSEAIKLAYLARKKEKVLYTDYTEMTAPSRLKMVELSSKIGSINKFYAETSQYGKFTDHSVAWQLASHQLSVASLFFDLSKINFSIKKNIITDDKIFNECIISGENIKNEEKIKLVSSRKMKLREKKYFLFSNSHILKYYKKNNNTIILNNKDLPMCMSERYNFDEDNNLRYSINRFKDCIEGTCESNISVSLTITKILEELHQ